VIPVDGGILRSLVGDPNDETVTLVGIHHWPWKHAIHSDFLPGLADLGNLGRLYLQAIICILTHNMYS